MAIRLPKQWPAHVKSGVLHAISLASVVLSYARGHAKGRRRLRVELEKATTEISLLREELNIKDGRWERSRSRRRPHYTPVQRMRIPQLRAARGWTLEKTARVFLVDLHTLQIWMRRLDERGERELIQTVEPVNRFPDLVRNVVRQLKCLFPEMGCERMAEVLARAGLILGATTIRRMIRERGDPPEDDAEVRAPRRKRVVARYPGHTWHVDLTAVPTRAGFWVPWLPFSLPQRWPFCWWVAVAVDQVSRTLVGFAVFDQIPSASEVQSFLNRAIRAGRTAPKYVITDKGKQFWCRSFKRWCKHRGIRPRYGAVGQPASIAIVERFILSMKRECTRCLLVPLSMTAMRREIGLYGTWYNTQTPHMALAGKTPHEVYAGRAERRQRFEPRTRLRSRLRRRGGRPDRLHLAVSYVEGREHLPVIELRRAA
jgi:transposase InsO family protein